MCETLQLSLVACLVPTMIIIVTAIFQTAALPEGRTMMGLCRLLHSNVYDALSNSRQQAFTHQVSKMVVTILWISFSRRDNRNSRTALYREAKTAITCQDKDIGMANSWICNVSI